MLRRIAAFALLLGPLAAGADEVQGRARVADGDTMTVAGEKVRLFGIDAPELHQSCTRADGTAWTCGAWAKGVLDDLVGGQEVTCTGDSRDRYGRLLARCAGGGRDLGDALVRAGAAVAFRRYSTDYVDAEKAAIFAGAGVWQGGFDRPEDYRASLREATPPAIARTDTDCPIKGNISGSGRIYHLPGQEDYDATRIDPARGERWFCSEGEARAAGWRRARR
jgi:endonuclease YncB( thermonuclease family)